MLKHYFIAHIFLLILISNASIQGQDITSNFRLDFQIQYQNHSLLFYEMDEEVDFEADSSQINKIKFYIGQICLLKNDKIVFNEGNAYHLINSEDPKSFKLMLDIPINVKYDAIKFAVGVDSLTNVGGPIEGDLDPINGMYWTWNNGYINFKLEGHHPHSSGRNQEFQYHLGGFLAPFQTIQTVLLPITTSSNTIVVDLDVLLKKVDFNAEPNIMSPGEKATALSAYLPAIFSVR